MSFKKILLLLTLKVNHTFAATNTHPLRNVDAVTSTFFIACTNAKLTTTETLLAAKITSNQSLKTLVNAVDGNKQTPLHYLMINYFKTTSTEKRFQYCIILHLLLAYQADPNIQDRWGNTPLHYLQKDTSNNGYEMMSKLMQNGARVSIRNNKKETVLHLAHKRKCKNLIALYKHLHKPFAKL